MSEEVKVALPAAAAPDSDESALLLNAAKNKKKKKTTTKTTNKTTKKIESKAIAPKVKPHKPPSKAKGKSKAPKLSKKRLAELLGIFTDNYSKLVLDKLAVKGSRKQFEEFVEKAGAPYDEIYSSNKNDQTLSIVVAQVVLKANYNEVLRNVIEAEARTGALQLEEKGKNDQDKVEEHVRNKVEKPSDDDLDKVFKKHPSLENSKGYMKREYLRRASKLPEIKEEDVETMRKNGQTPLISVDPDTGAARLAGEVKDDELYFDSRYINLDINNTANIERLFAMYDIQ